MFVIELLYGTQGKKERKKNDRASTMSQNITSVKAEEIRIYTESLKHGRREVKG
jgi:hypothetical protein